MLDGISLVGLDKKYVNYVLLKYGILVVVLILLKYLKYKINKLVKMKVL